MPIGFGARIARHSARRGRGLRGPLLPPGVPASRSRAEGFDLLVLDAFAPIDAKWHDDICRLDIAVDDIPRMHPRDPDTVQWPPEVIADGPVPLARLIPAGVDKFGEPTRARVVLFRRPIELRARGSEDLVALIHDLLVAQIATYLGVEPEVVDPETEDPA